MNSSRLKILMLGLLTLPLLVACGKVEERFASPDWAIGGAEVLTVYKSRSCGCCKKWIDHIDVEGFETDVQHPSSLKLIKDRYRIAPNLRSCHTSVSSQGYVFEGHIPARYIQQFLANPPSDAVGLTVPAMPLGSPGMEAEDRFRAYQVLLMKKDGNTEVFVSVENPAQQYQPGDQQEVQL